MKKANVRFHIRQLCCLGLPAEQLMPALLKAIRQLVGAESAGFFWVNSAGDMTSLYAERLLPTPAMRLYFERYYDSGELSFRQTFIERAGRREPVTSTSASPLIERSQYYNEVLRHLDAHHVMYGIVREHGEAVGQLSLYRSKSSPAFSAEERSELASVMRYVVHGLVQRGQAHSSFTGFADTEDDAVLLINAEGEIRHQSLAAQKLLLLATQGGIGREQLMSGAEEAAQWTLRHLADGVQNVFSGAEVKPPNVVFDNRWGRFVLRAYAVSDDPRASDALIAVRIQRQEPLLLRFVEALNKLELSPQQREIAVGLAKGSSNRELAESMGVSMNTVAYHVKQLFMKLDSHDRQQVIAKVLAESIGPAT